MGMSCSFPTKILVGILKMHIAMNLCPCFNALINSTIGKLSDSSGKFIFNLAKWPSDTLRSPALISNLQIIYSDTLIPLQLKLLWKEEPLMKAPK
jgi:hypothetical protein